jgi:hypothetical protein
MSESPSDKTPRTAWVAFGVVLAAGSVLALSSFVDVPGLVVFLAALGFLLSGLLAGVVAAREARRADISFPTAVGRGAKTALRWLWQFLP